METDLEPLAQWIQLPSVQQSVSGYKHNRRFEADTPNWAHHTVYYNLS